MSYFFAALCEILKSKCLSILQTLSCLQHRLLNKSSLTITFNKTQKSKLTLLIIIFELREFFF